MPCLNKKIKTTTKNSYLLLQQLFIIAIAVLQQNTRTEVAEAFQSVSVSTTRSLSSYLTTNSRVSVHQQQLFTTLLQKPSSFTLLFSPKPTESSRSSRIGSSSCDLNINNNNNDNDNRNVDSAEKQQAYTLKMFIQMIGKSTTIVVAGSFFVALAIKRNTLMVSFFIGAVLNGILSKVCKKIIAQTRPIELRNSTEISDIPSDHGMPSSHAMSMGFIATFTASYIRELQLPLILYTIVCLYYRIMVKLHTWQQVIVGTIMGSTNGYIWYRFCIGQNPFGINMLDLVQRYIFRNNQQQQFPIPYLIVPFLIGTATIGSFQRRIRTLLQLLPNETKKKNN